MKEIKPEELPNKLDDATITILAQMSMQFPINKNWRVISKGLSDKDRLLIRNRRSEIEREEIELKGASMSEAEKKAQTLKKKRMLEKLEKDPHTFYGNMGQPETTQEFKNRYGVWPTGYDERINPYNLPDVLTDKEIDLIARIYIDYKSPQYWAEISSALINKKTNQLELIFEKVYKIKGRNFPMHGDLTRPLTYEEFKICYGICPPGNNEDGDISKERNG